MKLRQITENLMMQQIRGQLMRNGPYGLRSQLHTQGNNYSGYDYGSRSAGLTMLPTGVPHKQRHRQYLGLEHRPGTIRL